MNHPSSLFEERRIYSLFEVAESIRESLQMTYPDFYWIKAEIAKLSFYAKSGHCYADLVEKQGKIIKAEMRAIIWSGNYQMIVSKFRKQAREELKDGMSVLFLASLNFHEVYGLSLNIIDIEPSFTMGELAREKRDTIDKLKLEGIFDLNRSLEFPLLPKRIAVISVESSKGYHDLLATINNNPFGYRIDHRLYPALLQGDKAVETILEQLRTIAEYPGWYDVVAIIRGGGGEVGLSAYDSYELAREVACFPLPVMTGIGHSTNETVVEMVAHTNLITPTAVANFLIQQLKNVEDRLDELHRSLASTAALFFENSGQYVSRLTQRFHMSTNRLLERNIHILENAQYRTMIFTRQSLALQNQNMDSLEKKIKLLNPLNILQRGYSITYFKGIPLTDPGKVVEGDHIETRLFLGTVRSTVD